MIETRMFETQKLAVQYMENSVTQRGLKLAYGVGNDMSGPFYTYQSRNVYSFKPNGIGNGIEYLGWKV